MISFKIVIDMTVDYQKLLLDTSEDEYEVVLKEFDATDKILKENLERIKGWLKVQPHLCEIQIG